MLSTKPKPTTAPTTWLAAGVAAALLLGLTIWYFLPPPQMGADADVFHTVDALYTAVRSQNEKQLALCETKLAKYREDGKLPPASADYLDSVIARAKAGNWDAAARRLHAFMSVQRREGEMETKHEPRKKRK